MGGPSEDHLRRGRETWNVEAWRKVHCCAIDPEVLAASEAMPFDGDQDSLREGQGPYDHLQTGES